ncbi:MAG: hypothetical protein CSA29_03165 [Desulfobacterales bacterium]|nr:MAG: hypothetical protein CSA29_03165 [Desulfobacterales bacterium]
MGEVSGVAASRKNAHILWMVNDSGNAPTLYAVRPNGTLMADFPLKGIKNTDWEDMSGFSHNAIDYLVIADVGDNKARRHQCSLIFIPEPALTAARGGHPITDWWQMKFKYDNGPRDCESVAVDTAKRILLLSKRDKYPILYQLPLIFPPKDIVYTAKFVARLTTLPKPIPFDLMYNRYQPTSMALSSNGCTLVILSYTHAYLFNRQQCQTWQDAFNTPPTAILLPLPETGELIQREALCIDHQTGALFVTTEKIPAPIYRIDPAN